MAVDSRQQSQLHAMPYDPLRFTHFSNPWVGGPAVSNQMVPSSQASAGVLDAQSSLQHRLPSLTLPPYTSLTATTTSLSQEPLLAAAYSQHSPLQTATDINGQTYQFVPASSAVYQPAQAAPAFIHLPDRSSYGYGSDPTMRASSAYSSSQDIKRESFDVVDASRGMLSLSQNDITPTPKNMFGAGREPDDSYGFPASTGAHSSHSSISSASGVGAGGGGSALHSSYGSPVGDYSLTDYSSASESVDGLNHPRTLPRPATMGHHHPGSGVGIGLPQQSMMGQFSSKVPNGIQKKHKCKVCDKRFTRPSSLQTHIYSHTGEKPFACEVEGCGRHFSVVSNLRRHHRVHRNERSNEESDDGLPPDTKTQYDS